MKSTDLLSTIEAAQAIENTTGVKLSPETIKYNAANKMLPAQKVAGRWLIKRSDLMKWYETGRRRPGLKPGQKINRKAA